MIRDDNPMNLTHNPKVRKVVEVKRHENQAIVKGCFFLNFSIANSPKLIIKSKILSIKINRD